VVAAENAAAHAHDHGAMPAHKDFKGRFFMARDERFQEFFIGQTARIAQQHETARVRHHRA